MGAPRQQLRSADALLQQGPRIQISVAGQSLVDLVISEALVRTAGACPVAADPGGSAAVDLVLGCTKRRLEDVPDVHAAARDLAHVAARRPRASSPG